MTLSDNIKLVDSRGYKKEVSPVAAKSGFSQTDAAKLDNDIVRDDTTDPIALDSSKGRSIRIYNEAHKKADVEIDSSGTVISVLDTVIDKRRHLVENVFQDGVRIGWNKDDDGQGTAIDDGSIIRHEKTSVTQVDGKQIWGDTDGNKLLALGRDRIDIASPILVPGIDKGSWRHPNGTIKTVNIKNYDTGFYLPVGEDAPDVGIKTMPQVSFPDNDMSRGSRAFQCIPACAYVLGRLWTAFYSQKTIVNEHNGGFITIRFNDNETDAYPLIDAVEAAYFSLPDEDNTAMADVQMWTDPNGKLWIFLGVVNNDANPAIGWGFWAVCVNNPLAARPTFSKPMRMHTYGVPGKPILVGNKALMPVDCRETTSLEDVGIYPNFVGKTIYEFDYLSYPPTLLKVSKLPNDVGPISYQESSLAEDRSGGLMSVYRMPSASGGVYISRNATGAPDGWTQGLRWDAIPVGATAESKKRIRKLKSGNLAIAFNDSSARQLMSLGISTNDGLTMKSYVRLETSSVYCSYPDIQEDAYGNIIVVYDVDRFAASNPVGYVQIVTVKETDLLAGTGLITPIITKERAV